MSSEYEVRNEAVEKLLDELGHYLRDKMPKGFGFTLLISSYGEGGSLFYTSSVERPGVLSMMQEFIDRHKFDGADRSYYENRRKQE